MVGFPFSMVAEFSCASRMAGVCAGLFSTGARVASDRRILRVGALLLAGVGFCAANLAGQVSFGAADVGTTTPVTQTVTLTSAPDGNSPVIASISVLTQGTANLDFTNAGGGTCTTGQTLNTGQTCTVVVNFKPKVAGTRNGAVVLLDSGGWIIATSYIQGTGTGPQLVFSPVTESYVGHGLNGPGEMAVDGAGAVYVCDAAGRWVIKYTPSGSAYGRSEIIGGTDGYYYVLAYPLAIALDGAGNVFVSDWDNERVLEWVPGANGTYQEQGLYVSGRYISSIAVDGAGNVYLADIENKDILKETPSGSTYTQSTLSFTGVDPDLIAMDSSGSLYIGDDTNNAIYKETLSGGTYTQGTIVSGQYSLNAVDSAGNVYVDTTAGVVKYIPTGGTYTASAPLLPSVTYSSVGVDSSGNLYYTSYTGSDWEAFKASVTSPPSLGFATTGAGGTSSDSPQTITVQNIGNEPLDFSAISYPPDFPEASGVASDCNSSTPLAAVGVCTLSIDFSPLASTLIGTSTALSETVSLTDNTLNQAGTMQSVSVSGTEIATQPAAITSPVPESTLTGSSATFSWTAGSGVTQYSLHVGTTGGGSTNVFGGAVTGTSKSVTGIPTTGATLYVTLYSLINGAWQSESYTYTEAAPATPSTMTSPASGSTLTSSTVTFSWTAGSQVSQYDLHVGTTGAGSSNIFGGAVTGQSKSVTGIPTTGGTLNVRLYSLIAGAWQYNDYTYTEESPAAPSAITAPVPGSTLTSSTVVFSWSAGSQVAQNLLHVGTTGAGSSNIFGGAVTGQSKSVTGIPTTGGTLYVRLYSQVNGAWQDVDYTYTEESPAAPAAITSPTPGSTLTGSSATFTWTAGSQVTQYVLHVGTAGAGSDDIFGGAVTGLSKSVTGIPITGGTLYVRLYSFFPGSNSYIDYIYTEERSAAPASMTSPTPGSTLTGSTVLFSWTAGSQVTSYYLKVGTTGVGSTNIYGAAVSGQSQSVSGIPTTGGTLYVSLYSLINGAYQYTNYTYTEQ